MTQGMKGKVAEVPMRKEPAQCLTLLLGLSLLQFPVTTTSYDLFELYAYVLITPVLLGIMKFTQPRFGASSSTNNERYQLITRSLSRSRAHQCGHPVAYVLARTLVRRSRARDLVGRGFLSTIEEKIVFKSHGGGEEKKDRPSFDLAKNFTRKRRCDATTPKVHPEAPFPPRPLHSPRPATERVRPPFTNTARENSTTFTTGSSQLNVQALLSLFLSLPPFLQGMCRNPLCGNGFYRCCNPLFGNGFARCRNPATVWRVNKTSRDKNRSRCRNPPTPMWQWVFPDDWRQFAGLTRLVLQTHQAGAGLRQSDDVIGKTHCHGESCQGLLVDLHTPMPEGRTLKHMEKNSCGFLSTRAAQHVLAAKWASEVINNQSRSQGVHIAFKQIFLWVQHLLEGSTRDCRANFPNLIPLVTAKSRTFMKMVGLWETWVWVDGPFTSKLFWLMTFCRGVAGFSQHNYVNSLLSKEAFQFILTIRDSVCIPECDCELLKPLWSSILIYCHIIFATPGRPTWVTNNGSSAAGLISVGDPDVVEETVRTLHAFQIPLILASPRLAEMVRQEGNILTTAPDMSSVVKGSTQALAFLKENIERLNVEKHQIWGDMRLTISGQTWNILNVRQAASQICLAGQEANETIGLLLEPEEIYTIVQYLRNYKSNNNKLLLGTIGLNKNFLKLWKNVFNGGYLVEPHMAELPDFRNYFLNVLQSAQKNDNKLVKEYISTTYDCNWNNTKVNGKDDCSRLEIKQLAGKLQIDLEVTFVVKAVSAFSAAVFLVQAQLCNENPLNCSVSHTNLQQDILATLSQLSFTSQHDAPFELQGTTLHITHDGQLVSNKYIIYHIQNSGDVSVVLASSPKSARPQLGHLEDWRKRCTANKSTLDKLVNDNIVVKVKLTELIVGILQTGRRAVKMFECQVGQVAYKTRTNWSTSLCIRRQSDRQPSG
uniref:Uncharacterized protein n=1 Tax=Timema genevievae TaxID=629358 RepID=A0A7R9PMH9_TIMGE|nr:unnamed protein product [Timema genevievae]